MDVNIIKLVRLALSVLSDRLLTLVSLVMTFALACWVMKEPDLMRECMAGFFALFVFIPCILKEKVKSNEGSRQEDEHQ